MVSASATIPRIKCALTIFPQRVKVSLFLLLSFKLGKYITTFALGKGRCKCFSGYSIWHRKFIGEITDKECIADL